MTKTAIHWRRPRLMPKKRSAMIATRTRPPEIATCTSVIGASASAATCSSQARSATPMPMANQRAPHRCLEVCQGCCQRTSGTEQAPRWRHRNATLVAAAHSSATPSPTTSTCGSPSRSPSIRSSPGATHRRTDDSSFLEWALKECRQDDRGARAGDRRRLAEALEDVLEVDRVLRADDEDGARLARHRVGGGDLGMRADRGEDVGAGEAPLGRQLDDRLRLPAEAARVDERREALDDALGAQPVDAPLDRRRGQRDVRADVLERAPGVLAQQCNDLPVCLVD